jgi:hypothetical protein
MSRLELVLNLKKEELDRVFGVLMDAGLLRIEIEPDKKRTVCKLDNAQKLGHFAQFVRESKHGPTKKLVRKTCKLNVKEVERALERATGIKFERDALDKAIQLKLLAVQGEGDQEEMVMKPSHLGRTVACVEAVRKLMALDQVERDKAAKSRAA